MPRHLAVLPLLAVLVAADSPRPADGVPEFFRRTTHHIADACLSDAKTLDNWQRVRPQLRQQLFDMLGLAPLPERTPLHPVVTGIVAGDTFVVEKLHFQSRPGLYVTANFYRPKLA